MNRLIWTIAGALTAVALAPSVAMAAPNSSASCTAEWRQPFGGIEDWAQGGLGGDWGQEVQAFKRDAKPIGQTFCDPFPPAGG